MLEPISLIPVARAQVILQLRKKMLECLELFHSLAKERLQIICFSLFVHMI